MRELKFRAWQTYTQEMYQPLSGYIELYPEQNNDIIVGFDDGDVRLGGKSVILMQYTGLKDKNGKDIYDGDVVAGMLYCYVKIEKGKGIVRFGEWVEDPNEYECGPKKHLGWYIELMEIEYDSVDKNVSLAERTEKPYHLEVIGNIYENPELLK